MTRTLTSKASHCCAAISSYMVELNLTLQTLLVHEDAAAPKSGVVFEPTEIITVTGQGKGFTRQRLCK